jgi:cyclopropane-fatty-acyl-phospholipid synthase
VKEHVRANFDASPAAYETYEARTGRFAALAERLLDLMRERQRGTLDRALDAGAGSGASTRVLEREGYDVVALDISRAMLRANEARNRVQADFDVLPFAARRFDGVAFTASLFLTTTPDRAAREAHRVVRPGGTVGAVAPLGWTTADGRDVFEVVGTEVRSPTATDDVEAALRAAFDVTTGTWTFETTAQDLRLFHAVPAMAARLYPRLDPEQRVERAGRLLADVEGPLRQHWRWFVGARDRPEREPSE